MSPAFLRLSLIASAVVGALVITASLDAADWKVPVAGNAFLSAPSPDDHEKGFRKDGIIAWSEAEQVYSVFFHIDRPAALDLSLNAKASDGRTSLVAHVAKARLVAHVEGSGFASHKLGTVDIPHAGYVRVDLKGEKRTGKFFAEIHDLVLTSATDGLVVEYVKTNEGNMFYWGRRGPSVHLTYETPKDVKQQYAYSEITVPKGQDTIGSYFMANGFAEGYFGIQVNSHTERRVLFSVWSPFQTDNPRDIPEDQRIVRLGAGPQVKIGEFGNEGAGGQSFLVFPWKADVTYCFLTEVKPDGPSNTVYTAWFCEKPKMEWRLIASFRRPKTHTYLRGFHSFLENFNPAYGHITRSAHYENVWVCDVDGKWHECNKAKFSVDATGGGRHRLDFMGGSEGDHFFLRNCGFFNGTGKAGEVFTRKSSAAHKPHIDFNAIPRP
jgi:hypothetical protein